MGTPNCVETFSLEPSEWIDIFGVVVNAVLALWIVRTIQKKLTNRRVLKDHFINEVKEIRTEYKNCLGNLYDGKSAPYRVLSWFKLMNIKVNDLMGLINQKYKIDVHMLNPYQQELRELVTNNPDYMSQYNSEDPIQFSEDSRLQFIKFQQTHNHLFNDLIILINDSE